MKRILVLLCFALFAAPPTGALEEWLWQHRNLGKAVIIWALVEAPALLGLVGYLVTHVRHLSLSFRKLRT